MPPRDRAGVPLPSFLQLHSGEGARRSLCGSGHFGPGLLRPPQAPPPVCLPPPARRPAPTAAGSLGPGRDMWSRLGYGGAGYGGDGGAAAGCGAGHYGGYSSGYGGYGAGYRSGYATVASEDCCAAACGTGAGAGPGGAPVCGEECGTSSCCGSGRETDVLGYVGPGGDYAQQTTYKYVGGGAGQFGVVRMPGASSSCCLLLVPLGFLLLLLPLLAWMFWPQTTTTTTTPLVVTTTTHVDPTTTAIDCDAGDEDLWSDKKKESCCDRTGKGCSTITSPPPPRPRLPAAPPTTTTSPCPIDCSAGYNDMGPFQWVHGWSAAKKIYCCKVAGKGCASELPPPSGNLPSGIPPEPVEREYDCDAGYHDCPKCLKESWSPMKMDWCCKTRGKGCVNNS
ncbi:unnamed protein product [Prorocentrum cordatum]|uniref:Cellulase n=1 Tax=Prorocentrum cordatum TaxID=2364126 RepID=A0ABN9UCL0_9DINO|nr:unnamed protein product [Polarella glacialis]